jgi:hypothetical protein
MDESLLGVMEIVGPILLLVVLVWAVMRTRSRGRETSDPTTEEATRDLYKAEDRAHRDGTEGR